MKPNIELRELVEEHLAARNLPGAVTIRPHKPLAARLESGERARFIVTYDGVGTAQITVDDSEISCGTIGAPIAKAIADKIERARHARLAAA